MKEGSISAAIGRPSDATIALDVGRLGVVPDYFATVTVVVEEGTQRTPRFTGIATKARVAPDGVIVTARGALSLLENLVGDGRYRIPNVELIYVLGRLGGFRDDQLDIEGIDDLPLETFEIITPLDGLELTDPVDVGNVRLLPPTPAIRKLAALDDGGSMSSDFEASAYALAFSTNQRTLAAEQAGLEQIDLALSWLTARLRYGLAVRPDGSPLPFERSDCLAQVTRRDLVAIRGLSTMRQWIRRPRVLSEKRSVALDTLNTRLKGVVPPLTLQERLAFLALRRAAQEGDPLTRVQALFEAIEFYASGVKVPKLFTRTELALVRESLPPSLGEKQRKRLHDMLSDVNTAPLRLRLVQALDDDDVPLSTDELDLLWRLRALRNDVVHGRRSGLPHAEDLEYATSIVARMLVYRADKKAATSGHAPGLATRLLE
jgi:hypothetical protein